MNQSTKQRVVGITVILVAAAVILPVLFDGQGSYELPLESRIPEPIPFPTPARVLPERPVVVADSEQIRGMAVAAEVEQSARLSVDSVPELAAQTQPIAAPVPVAPNTPSVPVAAAVASEPVATAAPLPVTPAQAPVLGAQGLPQGWSVRLASFGNQDNARNLMERLKNRGHRAYTRQLSSAQGPLTAVFVGPGVDRATMTRLLEQLRDEFQLSGMLVPYEIEEL